MGTRWEIIEKERKMRWDGNNGKWHKKGDGMEMRWDKKIIFYYNLFKKENIGQFFHNPSSTSICIIKTPTNPQYYNYII